MGLTPVCQRTGLAPTRSRPLSPSGAATEPASRDSWGDSAPQCSQHSPCPARSLQSKERGKHLLELRDGGRVLSISPSQAEDTVTERHGDVINRAPEGEADWPPARRGGRGPSRPGGQEAATQPSPALCLRAGPWRQEACAHLRGRTEELAPWVCHSI